MTGAIAQYPAPARPTRRRALLVFAVLLGLFLMHGMAASTDAACAAPAPAQITAGAADQSAASTQVPMERGVSDPAPSSSAADTCLCDHAMASCTPLTGRDTDALLGALLLALAAACALQGAAARPLATRARRTRRRGVPVAVLDLLCVSRT